MLRNMNKTRTQLRLPLSEAVLFLTRLLEFTSDFKKSNYSIKVSGLQVNNQLLIATSWQRDPSCPHPVRGRGTAGLRKPDGAAAFHPTPPQGRGDGLTNLPPWTGLADSQRKEDRDTRSKFTNRTVEGCWLATGDPSPFSLWEKGADGRENIKTDL